MLWGSFELRNRQLMAKMVQQSHKHRKLSELSESALNKVANDFEKLPIKFLNFQEAMGIEQVSGCSMVGCVRRYVVSVPHRTTPSFMRTLSR